MSTHHVEEQASRTVVGCLRGVISACAGLLLAAFIGIGAGNATNVWMGIAVGGISALLFLSISAWLMNTARTLTVLDCILPIPIGLISSILFAPISLMGLSIFSIATCTGAAAFLSVALFMYRAKRITGGWLIMPFLVFVYELLPIEIPGDIDNFLALGGNATNMMLMHMKNNSKMLE